MTETTRTIEAIKSRKKLDWQEEAELHLKKAQKVKRRLIRKEARYQFLQEDTK